MAVIITDMNLPRGCFECPLREEHGLEGDWCAVSEGCDLIGETTRPDYCPLKTTDEMIKEIEELWHYFPMGHDYEIAINRSLSIIHKYCDKEPAHEEDN